jgi:hypothetical protein
MLKKSDLRDIIREYTDDWSDLLFVGFVECFSFHQDISIYSDDIQEAFNKFLEEQDLVEAYETYVSDYVRKETKYFAKSASSDVDLIENIKSILSEISFHRFRQILYKTDE